VSTTTKTLWHYQCPPPNVRKTTLTNIVFAISSLRDTYFLQEHIYQSCANSSLWWPKLACLCKYYSWTDIIPHWIETHDSWKGLLNINESTGTSKRLKSSKRFRFRFLSVFLSAHRLFSHHRCLWVKQMEIRILKEVRLLPSPAESL